MRSTSSRTQEDRVAPIAQETRSTSSRRQSQEYRDAPIAQDTMRSTSTTDREAPIFEDYMRRTSLANPRGRSPTAREIDENPERYRAARVAYEQNLRQNTDPILTEPLRSTSSSGPLRSTSSQQNTTTSFHQQAEKVTQPSQTINNDDPEIRFNYQRQSTHRDNLNLNNSPIQQSDIESSLLQTMTLHDWQVEQDKIDDIPVEASRERLSEVERPILSEASSISDVPQILHQQRTVQTKQVHRTKKVPTTTIVVDGITKNCIFKGTDKRRKLEIMHNHLEQAGLLTMLLGHRPEPECLTLSDTGYTPQTLVRRTNSDTYSDTSSSTSTFNQKTNRDATPSQYITIPEDDIFLYMYDKSRLMALVRIMFHSSYDSIGEKAAIANDPIAYYHAMIHHIFGNTSKDINEAWQHINQFKIKMNASFCDESVRWERLFENVYYASGTHISDNMKIAFLMKHVYPDPRRPWSQTMQLCSTLKYDYATTMQALRDATDEAPDHMQSMQVYNVQSNNHTKSRSPSVSKVPFCRNWNNGDCRRGDTCKFSHTRDPTHNSNHTSEPRPVSKDHRREIYEHNNKNKGQYKKRSESRPRNSDNRNLTSQHKSISSSHQRDYDSNQRYEDYKQYSTSQRPQRSTRSRSPSRRDSKSTNTSHVKSVRTQEQQDFQSWGDTQSKGYKNGSFNALSIKRSRSKEHESDDEEEKIRQWDRRRQEVRDRDIRHDARNASKSTDNKKRRRKQRSNSQGFQSDILFDDDTPNPSLPCQSSSSNRTQRPTPHFRRSRSTSAPSRQQPSKTYLSDLDGTFADYNMKSISNDLTRLLFCVPKHPYNKAYVSAYLRIEAYYAQPYMEPFYKAYDTDTINVGISPHAFLYIDKDDNDKIRMFNYNKEDDIHNDHVRKDITENTREWYTIIVQAAVIAFSGIANLPFLQNINHDFTVFQPRYFTYIYSRDMGHYWSQQEQIYDYYLHANCIGITKARYGECSNEILIDTLLCALVYDFMAFVSQILGIDRYYNVDRVHYIRQMLINDIKKLHPKSFFKEQHLDRIFIYIINESIPVYDHNRIMVLCYHYAYDLNKYCPPHIVNNTQLTIESNKRSKVILPLAYLSMHRFNAISRSSNRIIIDTGASLCATSDKTLLTNITPCHDMIAYPAFGKQIKPKLRGEYGDLNLEALVIPSMPDTLLSVSQLCYGGKTKQQNIAVFTTEGVRVFTFDSVREALKLMHDNGHEILRGYETDGIYVTDKKSHKNDNKHRLFLAKFKPQSLYDHLHMVTGHPGEKSMKWHRENSLNAKYTEHDAHQSRGICQGCVYGALGPTNTDQYREHREVPVIPGQCFALDAYTHHCYSKRGRKYCNLFTDLATRRIYPVFTKTREAHELCKQVRMLFLQKPDWKAHQSREQTRFIRLDSEGNYSSEEFLALASSFEYNLERTPVRDKHANGIAERSVGLITAKTNVAMMSPTPQVPQSFWDFAMAYACDTHSYNFSSVIGTSPYMKITGKPIDIKYLQPFWASCYVFIPREERNKLGSPRAYKAHLLGYANTNLQFPNYIVQPVIDGYYTKYKDSKNVIFDPSINFSVYTENEEPYDREFENTDHYVPFLQRQNAPDDLKGPDAQPQIENNDEVYTPIIPQRTPDLLPQSQYRHDTPAPPIDENNDTTPDDETADINEYRPPYETENGNPVYWYKYFVKNNEYPLIMCEAQHFKKIKIARDPNVPDNYYKAMRLPEWKIAIDKELTKFEKNLCLQLVPYNNQHLVPMMWLFVIKSDGTKKARLVGRGDLMLPYIDFDPYAVYCGNVTASSIKMCITIAAKYNLFMKGGDLEGAYLVAPSNHKYPVYIKTPQGYTIPNNMCIQAVGNLYGFPPAGQNFSIEFDKCVKECGYVNTPWDLKFFYKWKNNKPMLIIVHSDDFRWFGDKDEINEWHLIVKSFEKQRYKVTDVTDNEFVGIKISVDSENNYYMDQTRMIDEILQEAHTQNEKDERLPYPNPTQAIQLSKADNATELNEKESRKYPYRRIVGQLMYGMVHTMVTIMYPLNVLSRYGNNPGPRHIMFLRHLLRYVRTTKTDRLKFTAHNGPYDIETMTNILQLYFQCDADLAGNLDNKHSQTSYLGYLGNCLICWCSTDQGSISTSTAESEMKAVNHTLKCEIIANRGILTTMGWTQSATIIEEDNKACIDASTVIHMTKGMRHLSLTENFLKEKFADKTCVLKKVDSKENNADIGTKRLFAPLFEYLTFPLVDQTLRKIKTNKKKN